MRVVCAVILDYRNPALAIRCAESLKNEGFTSIVIVDNSEDGSSSLILKALLKKIDKTGLPQDIVVLTSWRNRGFAGGMNFAIKWLKNRQNSDYYLLLNNDTLVSAGSLKQLIAVSEQYSNDCIVGPSEIGSSNNSRLWYQKTFGLLSRRKIPGAFQYLSACCLLVPNALVGSNLFDEDFFMYGEDVFLSWKMHRCGKKLAVADISLHHIGSASAPHGHFFYEYHVVSGHFLLISKLAVSHLDKIIMFLGRTIALGGRAVLRSFRQHSKVPLQAFISVFYKELTKFFNCSPNNG